jgi:hypothetical protein
MTCTHLILLFHGMAMLHTKAAFAWKRVECNSQKADPAPPPTAGCAIQRLKIV